MLQNFCFFLDNFVLQNVVSEDFSSHIFTALVQLSKLHCVTANPVRTEKSVEQRERQPVRHVEELDL